MTNTQLRISNTKLLNNYEHTGRLWYLWTYHAYYIHDRDGHTMLRMVCVVPRPDPRILPLGHLIPLQKVFSSTHPPVQYSQCDNILSTDYIFGKQSCIEQTLVWHFSFLQAIWLVKVWALHAAKPIRKPKTEFKFKLQIRLVYKNRHR